jgi:flagellin
LAAGNDTFHLEFDLVQVDAGAASDNAAAVVTQNANKMTRTGEHHQLDVRAGGEAMTIDLKNSNATPTAVADRDQHFDGIGTAYQADPCGTFEIVAGTLAFGDNTGAAQRTNLSVSADGVLTLAAGAEQGTYNALVKYTNNDGESFFERVDISSVDIGEAAGIDIATATALTAAAGSRTATEQVAGTSVLSVAEARQGNIASTGTNSVLSAAFNTFVASYTGGSYSVSGADSAMFSINASTGAMETKGLVDFETKTSYSMTVSYTSGANTYSEDITLNVTDNAVDNTSHIANVDLSTQAGSATGVTILDKAIDQISESQAKLGAIQNRLQYNIDNLSKASMLTTTAKGRIMDADFAAETSELSKQQILSQAATSMLAQANQSKQSVLALLQ